MWNLESKIKFLIHVTTKNWKSQHPSKDKGKMNVHVKGIHMQ